MNVPVIFMGIAFGGMDILNIESSSWAPVDHTCNPSYLED
jgi:hypothetical protein